MSNKVLYQVFIWFPLSQAILIYEIPYLLRSMCYTRFIYVTFAYYLYEIFF